MTDRAPEQAEGSDAGTGAGRVDADASVAPVAGKGGRRLVGCGRECYGGGGPGGGGVNFDEVVAEHESAMLRYARHQLGRDYEGREHDAQDIVQEALLRLHRHWRDKGHGAIRNTRAWLMRVTHNLVIDAIRKRTRQRALRVKMQQEADSSVERAAREGDGLDALETREATHRALRLLRELPDTQQRVLMLKLDDLTVRQIAEVLGMSPGNVGYHLSQGLTTLAGQMKRAGVI